MPELSKEEVEKLVIQLHGEYNVSAEEHHNHRELINRKTNECHEKLRGLFIQKGNTSKDQLGTEYDDAMVEYHKAYREVEELKKKSYDLLDNAFKKLIHLRQTELDYYSGLIRILNKENTKLKAAAESSVPTEPEDNVGF